MQENSSSEQFFLQRQILKTLQMLTKRKKKKEAKSETVKGKNVPGKNLSKNSQLDGNHDEPGEPGTSKGPKKSNQGTKRPATRGGRTAAKRALANISEQSLLVDGSLPLGDKNFEPDDDNDDSETEEEEDSEEASDDGTVFETAQSYDAESEEEPSSRSRPLPSYNISYHDSDDDKYCWVESFEVDLNSKRQNSFVNFLINQRFSMTLS
jgi:hypothetical protein